MVGVLCPHVFGTIYSANACLLMVFSILSVVKDWVRQVGAQNITFIVACMVLILAIIIIALHELQ